MDEVYTKLYTRVIKDCGDGYRDLADKAIKFLGRVRELSPDFSVPPTVTVVTPPHWSDVGFTHIEIVFMVPRGSVTYPLGYLRVICAWTETGFLFKYSGFGQGSGLMDGGAERTETSMEKVAELAAKFWWSEVI